METRSIDQCLGQFERFPLIGSTRSREEWAALVRRPERSVLAGWLIWGNVIYDRALAALEGSLAVLGAHASPLLDHYLGELKSSQDWVGFSAVRSEIYIAAWLVQRGWEVRVAEQAGGRRADLVVSREGVDGIRIEVSACIRRPEAARQQRMWQLELRIRGLGVPMCVNLEALPETGADIKLIVRGLGGAARDLGDSVASFALWVRRGTGGWQVEAEPLGAGACIAETTIGYALPGSGLTTARLVEKLRRERDQLPRTGVNVICLDMSHVDDWYSTWLHLRPWLPLTPHLDELTPAMRQYFDNVDTDGRTAAVLLFTRDINRVGLDKRLPFARRTAMGPEALGVLLAEWEAPAE